MSLVEFPYIPNEITVHLGPPDSDAENVTLPFTMYVKNVASSEIYPTWPQSAVLANIYAIITFALNRVYTEWYRNKGYDFDITSSTSYDQKFIPNREIFKNINDTVDEVFDSYVRKKGTIGPYFTAFCNGTTVLCDGLSQWGTVDLANQGKNSFDILRYYYGDDIEIVIDVPISQIAVSYPGVPLKKGDIGNDVAQVQIQLNRIADNYPAIEKLDVDGAFGPLTEGGVKKFQEIFNLPQTGIVDKATWYKINYIFTSVKDLGELSSEGILYEEFNRPFARVVKLGDSGYEVRALQYALNLVGNVYAQVDPTEITAMFDKKTENSVKQFQELVGLNPTGIFDLPTFRKLETTYDEIVARIPPELAAQYPNLYPGYLISLGLSNDKVTQIQNYINVVSKRFPFVPPVEVTNVYDEQTDKAMQAIQSRYGIPITTTVGPISWYQLMQLYKQALEMEEAEQSAQQ